MKRRKLRLTLVSMTTLTAVIAAAIISPNSASATPAGTSLGISTTNGTKTVTLPGGHVLTLSTTASDGAWSPDGSQMAFVSGDAIKSVRFNDAADIKTYAPSDGIPKSHPAWSWGFPLWSAHVTDPQTNAESDVIQYAVSPGSAVKTLPLPAGINWTHPDYGSAGLVIQGQHGTDSPDLYLVSAVDSTNTHATLIVQDASSPSASPGFEQATFLRDDAAGHAQVWLVDLNNPGTAAQLTSDPVDHSNVTWSSDGSMIAFDENNAVFTAATDGSQAGVPIRVNSLTGVPNYDVTNPSSMIRVAGGNRYQTAVAISQQLFADEDIESRIIAQSVVLTRGDTFADALSASVLATSKQGPLLMTQTGSLDVDTKKEIKRILNGEDPDPVVYLIGGTGAISTTVENQIKAMGYATKRLSGDDRYATAVAVDKEITPSPSTIFAATGDDFPDALSASAVAGSLRGQGVVVLTDGAKMPKVTQDYLDSLNASGTPPTLIGVGGSGAAALEAAHDTNGVAIVGQDRYDTAVRVAKFFVGDGGPSIYAPRAFGTATGANWPDALAGSALLGFEGYPLLLTPPTVPNAGVKSYLDDNSVMYGQEIIFGQSDVVSNSVANAYLTVISGPTGTKTVNSGAAGQAAPAETGTLTGGPATLTGNLPSYVTPLS